MLSVYGNAARAVIKQHTIYTLPELESFLTEHYPGVPAQHWTPVVISAVEAAKSVASVHYYFEGSRAPEAKHRYATGTWHL